MPPALSSAHGPGSSAPQGLSSTIVYSGTSPLPPIPPATTSAPSSGPPAGYYEEERIEIPGTHVPAWVVVVLVVGVILVLAGTAFLFLR